MYIIQQNTINITQKHIKLFKELVKSFNFNENLLYSESHIHQKKNYKC